MRPDDLIYLLPELVLLASAALVFVLHLLRPDARSSRPWEPQGWLPYVALGSLGLAALAIIPASHAVFGAKAAPRIVASMLVADPLAIFFTALAIIGVAIVILSAIPYMRGRTPYTGEFYALLLVVALAVCLAVSATNLVMIYLSIEFLSITSYVLVGFLRQDHKSGEAAIKYFLYGSVASAVMLYGMSLLYGATGTTDLSGVAQALASSGGNELMWLTVPAIVLMLVGFGFKASLVPFHQWVPDTYEGAPTPVTAFLSTVSKAAGFAILIRVLLVAMGSVQQQWTALLVAISIVTMTVGNLTALRQTSVKRLLAYSSIAQAGYILIGLAAVWSDPSLPFTGINGVLIYLFAYLFANIGAFTVVAAIEIGTGKTDLSDYAGLVRRAPWLAALLFVFLISLAGIPPTGGFIGKFFVFGAAVQRQQWVLVAFAAVNTVVAAFYYLNVVRYMFLMPAGEENGAISVARPLGGALAVTALLTLLLGLAPGPLIAWATGSAQALLSALH